jgi:hypothetical protein
LYDTMDDSLQFKTDKPVEKPCRPVAAKKWLPS